MGLSGQITNCLKQYVNSFPLDKLFLSKRIFVHHHISYDMYLSSHTRGIPKKSGPSDQFRTYSGPLLALRSGSGPSPEFRTLVVPLVTLLQSINFSLGEIGHPVAQYGSISPLEQDAKSAPEVGDGFPLQLPGACQASAHCQASSPPSPRMDASHPRTLPPGGGRRSPAADSPLQLP